MSLPLHEQIRRELEGAILSGRLAAGSRLPTEQDLMQQYGCARMTVSKAIGALAAAGLVDRRKRAGTFVARPRVHSMVLDIPDLEQEVRARGQAYRFELLHRAVMRPDPSNPEEVQLAGSGQLLRLEGVHFADDEPLAHEVRLVSLAAVPDMASDISAQQAPGAWLLRHVPWTEAENRIAAIGADRVVSQRLGLALGAPCLFIERRTWRGSEGITLVRQHFNATQYDLVARFGPSKS
jgi:GntR family histidine utilization transcriptional repressor